MQGGACGNAGREYAEVVEARVAIAPPEAGTKTAEMKWNHIRPQKWALTCVGEVDQ